MQVEVAGTRLWFDVDHSDLKPDCARLAEVAATVERVDGGDRASVTDGQWARCWRLFGPWVTGEQERARTVLHRELNFVAGVDQPGGVGGASGG